MFRRIVFALPILLLAMPAEAHPHVWVTFSSEVAYGEDGALIGVHHKWTFDDMYSAFALQGLKHAKKGQYTREELASLAQLNMKSLKTYDYFTYAKADGKAIVFSDPIDYWLEYANSVLTLHFTLPPASFVQTKSLEIDIYDPTIFVDFAFAKDGPAVLEGASPQCHLKVAFPRLPTAKEQTLLSQLDSNPAALSSTYGAVFANKIFVACP
jgi:ABC-type uncharacterized transport system substrate-binding protein